MILLKKKIKIGFTEQSKAVTADVSIESDEMSTDDILKETRELFELASKFSKIKTLEKLRG